MSRNDFDEFIDAVRRGDVKSVEKMFRSEWIDKEYEYGRRPIHWACKNGHADIVRLLLNKGCQIEAADKSGRSPMQLAKENGHADVEKLLNTKSAERECDKDEFQIFHLETVTVVCSNCKISDFPYVVQKVQQNVLPLNRPILFCDSISDKSCLPLGLVSVEMVSDRLHYQEYVAVHKNDSTETISSRISELRNWDIDCSFEGSGKKWDGRKVMLQIESIKADSSWTGCCPVSFALCVDINATEKDIVQMLFEQAFSVEKMKTTVLDSLKFLYSVEIQKEKRQKRKFKRLENSVPLKRFLLVRKQLMTFFDKNSHKLNDGSTVKEIVDKSDGCVSVVQKGTDQMEFIPSKSDTISSLVSENTMVAICFTGKASFTALLRKDYQSAKDIRDEIAKRVSKSGRILMAHETVEERKIIEDDVDTSHVDDVVRFIVVSQFNPKAIRLDKRIGWGAFGEVFGCFVKGDQNNYVVKKIGKPIRDRSDMMSSDIAKEFLVASRIGTHPRIMKYDLFFEEKFYFYILMHRMEMSLSDYVKDNKPLGKEKIIFFTKQILEGVDCLHDNKIIHRSIKGADILIDASGDVKLADFGISKCLTIVSHLAQEAGANTCCGTDVYTAPEIIDGKETYGLKVDIWSVGATMVEMITGKMPFYGLEAREYNRLFREHNLPYECQHDDLKQFVASCLTVNPKDRPDCKELLSNPIFS